MSRDFASCLHIFGATPEAVCAYSDADDLERQTVLRWGASHFAARTAKDLRIQHAESVAARVAAGSAEQALRSKSSHSGQLRKENPKNAPLYKRDVLFVFGGRLFSQHGQL